MTIEQTNVIDAIGIDRLTGEVVLTVTDHLDWHSCDRHLQILAEKLNGYLAFIFDGQFGSAYPQYVGKKIRIDVLAQHEIPAEALARLHFDSEVRINFRRVDFPIKSHEQ